LQIFRWVAENLPLEPSFLRSALLESFLIHLRNLIDFFYTQPSDALTDDLVAGDFFDPPSTWDPGMMPKSLKDARGRANKEVSHITQKRKERADPTKPWPVADLFNEIGVVAQKFAAEASSKKLHPSITTWLKADPQMAVTLMNAASTSSSNATVGSIGLSLGVVSSSKVTGPVGQGGLPIPGRRTP